MDNNVKTAGSIAFSCNYHVVWCTKYRLELLQDGADEKLKKIVHQVAEEKEATIQEVEVLPDHIHILISCHPDHICSIVRMMKGRSSRVLREEFSAIKSRTPSLWTRSYFIATTGGAPLATIKKYIENQKKRRE